MRRTVNFLGWIFVVLTILALICTMLTTYNFSYLKYFSNYRVLQITIFFTMLIWAFNLYDLENGRRKWAYSAVFFLFALVALLFTFSYVK